MPRLSVALCALLLAAPPVLAQGYPQKPIRYIVPFPAGGIADDGWKFRGRGLIQLTFHDNYQAYSQAVSDPSVMADPDQVAQSRHAAISACWFWKNDGLNALADAGDEASFNRISHAINGGWNGKADRLESWAEARAVIVA
jgi:putative chitinase